MPHVWARNSLQHGVPTAVEVGLRIGHKRSAMPHVCWRSLKPGFRNHRKTPSSIIAPPVIDEVSASRIAELLQLAPGCWRPKCSS